MTYLIFSIGYIIHPMIMEGFGEVLELVIMGKDEEPLTIRIIH
jgi:hypothetical protein